MTGMMHSKMVAFGIATQLRLDDSMTAEYHNNIFEFMIAVGLPVTFDDLNITPLDLAVVCQVAENATSPGSLFHNHPFEVTAQIFYNAMLAADALGKAIKR